MNSYIDTEGMTRAANQMRDASHGHEKAANTMSNTVDRMQGLIDRFEAAAEKFHDSVERLILDWPGQP